MTDWGKLMTDWGKLREQIYENKREGTDPTNVFTLIRSLDRHRNVVLRVTEITPHTVYFVVVDHHSDKSFIGREVRVSADSRMFRSDNKPEVINNIKVGARVWVKAVKGNSVTLIYLPYIEHIRNPHRKTISNHVRY